MGNEIFNPYKKFSKNDESQIKEEINVKKSFEEFNLDNLVPFKNQPFKVYSNDEMKELKDSIERIGLQNPIIVRIADGKPAGTRFKGRRQEDPA